MFDIILKVVERCNINCDYCYYFNKNDLSWKDRPIFISKEVVENFASFLSQGIEELKIPHARVTFHGGEPLMLGKERFSDMCSIILQKCHKKVFFSIQTNGILIDVDWLEIFKKFDISVGLSLDGPQEYHDKHRVSKKGRGTYQKVIEKLDLLRSDEFFVEKNKISILGVISPEFCAKKIYDHFKSLNLSRFDLLLPDNCHGSLADEEAIVYGKFFCDLFDSWRFDEKIKIRFFDRVLSGFFKNFNGSDFVGAKSESKGIPALTVYSNGNIAPADDLRNVAECLMSTGLNVCFNTLKETVESEKIKFVFVESNKMPDLCSECCWVNVCHGGYYVHRYSKERHFNNPSVYCSGLKKIYSHIASHLIQNGYPEDKIYEALGC